MNLTTEEHGALAAVRYGFAIQPGSDLGRALEQLITKGLVELDPETGKPRLVDAQPRHA